MSTGKPKPASPSPWKKGLKGEAPVPTPPSAASLFPFLKAPRKPVGPPSSAQTKVGLMRGAKEGRKGPQGTGCPSGIPLSIYTGLPAPAPSPILRADLAGILGVSGVLIFGCVYLLYLLHRQKHWSVIKFQPPCNSPQTQMRARVASQASLASLRTPHTTVNTNHYRPATLDTVLQIRPLSPWVLPAHTACQPQPPAPWVPLPASAHSSFISIENGLYAQAGERPLPVGPNLVHFPDPLGHRAMEGHLGVR
ncbi:transmembrane protein PVRIG isoform X3 [Suricata suricatta]|uniref:transmembrane protein PVRIG isoform X3 n=1 Tax=Suricata suricatta TaxID=37032 RepID=UPI00115562F5|nr:transmembrane protein PVRIG isoform X3 [Suricata suricatta]